jgi:hypothetical protein
MLHPLIANKVAESIHQAAFDGWMFKDLLM